MHSSLLSFRKNFAGRRSFDVAVLRSPYPFCLGMARSFFSRSADKPEAKSPVPSDLIPSTTDNSTVVKEDPTKELIEMANNAIDWLKESSMATMSWLQKAKLNVEENIAPIIKERLDPSMSDLATQLAFTTIAAIMAWLVMPRLFRRFHRLLQRTENAPYELSFWAALEDPTRILITVAAFSQLCALIAPNTIAAHYLEQIWKGGTVVALVWFLNRWKSSVLARLLANRSLTGVERERYLALDKASSIGLFILGGMAVAETCGIAVQSVLTIGGIGGVATAYAARDILGNLFSGLALQVTKPFSIGDTIKAGSIEGQVLDIGLTATHLLDMQKFPVAVPNSLFSNQVIVNRSRAPWHAFNTKMPVHKEDFQKVPQITQEIRDMLKNHPKVYIHNGVPHCYVSRVGGLSLDISIVCNLKLMAKEELLSTEQDIILEAMKIVACAGATLGVPET